MTDQELAVVTSLLFSLQGSSTVLFLVELLAGAKFVYKSIIPVCIEFALDPECKSSHSRRITSSSRKPVVAALI